MLHRDGVHAAGRLACACLLLGSAWASGSMILIGLGDLPGGQIRSNAQAVSADGSVVVGYSSAASGDEAYRWTASDGMVGLGHLPEYANSYSDAVSADGSVVVGRVETPGSLAYRWTSGIGMVSLGDLVGGGYSRRARAVSTDGLVIAGSASTGSSTLAFRWTAATGSISLGDLAGGSVSSDGYDVSADGSVVVGSSVSGSGTEAFRWTEGSGMTGLGDLAGGLFSSRATAVSQDGSVVVGAGDSASGQEAFRWTAAGGMVGLGDLAGGSFNSVANGVSADGSVVVGYSSSAAAGAEPFIWDAASGMSSLTSVLAAGGADLSDWQLGNALGISANGRFVVGFGTHRGYTEGFLADLGVIPEPGSLGLLALAGGAALLRRQRRSRGDRA